MRILVTIHHPAHVHFFKHFIWNMEKKGHQVLTCATDKDIVLNLLDAYGFRYEKIGHSHEKLFTKVVDVLPTDWRLYRVARRFNPDILLGCGSINASHTSALLRKFCVLFDDDEYSPWSTYFFASTVCAFHNFKKDLGRKQVTLNGFKELAYLHPSYFTPDSLVTSSLGLKPGELFVIMRFVAWQASHDIKQYGFNMETKRVLINELEKYARVFITSESSLPGEFEKYRLAVPPEKLHDLLYNATLFVGDSQTMATEAAILGTPAIRCNSFVGPNDMGNFIELEYKYDLLYSFREADKAIYKSLDLLRQTNLKERWAKKRESLLADKIDVTQFMIDFIENYPESFHKEGTKSQL